MKYFFILGSNTTISLAEILAVLPEAKKGELIKQNVFIVETKNSLDIKKLMEKMGGTIKIGKIVANSNKNTIKLTETILRLIKTTNKKYYFGFSNYSDIKLNSKTLGMTVKKKLKGRTSACRWVSSTEQELSSVIVTQNKLLTSGQEFCLFFYAGKIQIGITQAVQDFKSFSSRDYGRPARDDHSGMLPPKLARIMINLAQINNEETILDPFCGSGTVLTEALVMGYKSLIGTDISDKAINDTKKNISWIKRKYPDKNAKIKLKTIAIKNLSIEIKQTSVNAVVTEPYLGEQRGKIDIKKSFSFLEKLYDSALFEIKKVLKPKSRAIIVWPVRQKNYLSVQLKGLQIISPLPKKFLNSSYIKLSKRGNLLYGRPNQKVWREIIILENAKE